MNGNPAYVIGLDGGGTKTTAQLADLNGTVVAEAQGGPSNFQIIGIEESARNLLDLIETCCHSVGCNNSEIDSVVAGLAGAGRVVDQVRMTEGVEHAAEMRGMYLRDLRVESDARIALEAALLGKQGIILIAGTGSIAFGKDSRGRISRAGGWGRVIGDEGSGYQIGREALRAVARMIDGRGRKTRIARMLDSKFGLKKQEDIIKAVYEKGLDIGSVAPLVLRAADQKDTVANEILDAAAEELSETVRAVFWQIKKGSKVSREKIPLVFIGGLLNSENVYSRKVKALIRHHLPKISVEESIAQPVRGAVLMAIERAKSRPGTKKAVAVVG